jgi:hypothetical protein
MISLLEIGFQKRKIYLSWGVCISIKEIALFALTSASAE